MNHLQLLLDCSELESRLSETLSLVNNDDYGKDQLATQSLITKHQVQLTLLQVCNKPKLKGPQVVPCGTPSQSETCSYLYFDYPDEELILKPQTL